MLNSVIRVIELLIVGFPGVIALKEIMKNKRTWNKFIWHDIFELDTWICLKLKDNSRWYLGIICLCEQNEREPLIVLNRYQVLNEKKEILIDYSQDLKRKLIIKTEDLEIAELIEI